MNPATLIGLVIIVLLSCTCGEMTKFLCKHVPCTMTRLLLSNNTLMQLQRLTRISKWGEGTSWVVNKLRWCLVVCFRDKEHPGPRAGRKVWSCGQHTRLPPLAHQTDWVHVSFCCRLLSLLRVRWKRTQLHVESHWSLLLLSSFCPPKFTSVAQKRVLWRLYSRLAAVQQLSAATWPVITRWVPGEHQVHAGGALIHTDTATGTIATSTTTPYCKQSLWSLPFCSSHFFSLVSVLDLLDSKITTRWTFRFLDFGSDCPSYCANRTLWYLASLCVIIYSLLLAPHRSTWWHSGLPHRSPPPAELLGLCANMV